MTRIRRLMARHDMAKMNQATVFALVFVLIEIISGATLYTNFVKTRQRYFSKELEQLQVAYQAIFNTYEQTARLLFSEIMTTPDFQKIIQTANTVDAPHQDALREYLLSTLRPRYQQGWAQNIDALEVHFPDGVNFLRVQDPSRYGDALFDIRSSIRMVANLRVAVKGFEHSADETGFRYLFPIYADNEYCGILEIGIALDGIREELEKLFMREFVFLLKRSSPGTTSDSGIHTQSALSAAYVRDATNIFIHEGEDTISAIDRKIRAAVASQLEQESAFVMATRVQRRDFLVTFLPVFDIERNHIAFIVSYKEDATVREYLNERALLMAGVSGANIFLLAAVYLLRRSKIRLAQGERRFKLITESMHEGVCVLDQDNRVTFVNRAGLWMLDYDREELQGVHLSDVTRYQTETGSVLQGRECPIYQVIAKGERYTSDQYVLLTKIGQPVPVELTSAPIFQGRAQIGSVVVIRDITVRKRTEAQLQQMNQQLQEASRHKSEFLSRMSHELRTPLNAMMGFTRITIEALKDHENPKLAQNLIKAERSSRKLLELINDVLDFSKIEAGRMEIFLEDVELTDVLDDALLTAEGLLLTNSVQLQTEIAPELPVLHTDYTKLTQILNNLIGNAVKFTEHGSVTIRAFLRQEAPGIRIEVEDTGCGIPEEKLGTIFESFKQVDSSTTKKYGGTGLGLAISKKFCDMLGIDIGVHSAEGQGSLFWLNMPVSSDLPIGSDGSESLPHQNQEQSEPDSGNNAVYVSGDAGDFQNPHFMAIRNVSSLKPALDSVC